MRGWYGPALSGASSPDVASSRMPLKILILGGTGFTGPEQVEYALARGHSVTLFNRNGPPSDVRGMGSM